MSASRRSGFTLVELLVVISIIGLLIALLLPAVQAAREAARRMDCSSRMHEIGIALHNYHDTYNKFPPGGITRGNCCGTKSEATWTIFILPYMEQSGLYYRYDFNAKNEDPPNQYVREQRMDVYVCPSDLNTLKLDQPESGPGNGLSYAPGTFRAVQGRCDGGCGWFDNNQYTGCSNPMTKRGVLHSIGTGVMMEETFGRVTDGSANTLMVGEMSTRTHNRRRTFWAYTYTSYNSSCITLQTRSYIGDYDRCNSIGGGGGIDTCKRSWGSNHPGALNWLYVDGSVHHIRRDVDLRILANMASIAGGESETTP